MKPPSTIQNIGLLAVIAGMVAWNFVQTARHNAQLMDFTQRHNAQLADFVERHNAQLTAMAEQCEARLALRANAP